MTDKTEYLSRREVRRMVGWARLYLPFCGFSKSMERKKRTMTTDEFRILSSSVIENKSALLFPTIDARKYMALALIILILLILTLGLNGFPKIFTDYIMGLYFTSFFTLAGVFGFQYGRHFNYANKIIGRELLNFKFKVSENSDIQRLTGMNIMKLMNFREKLDKVGYDEKERKVLSVLVCSMSRSTSEHVVSVLTPAGKDILDRAISVLESSENSSSHITSDKSDNVFSSLIHAGIGIPEIRNTEIVDK